MKCERIFWERKAFEGGFMVVAFEYLTALGDV